MQTGRHLCRMSSIIQYREKWGINLELDSHDVHTSQARFFCYRGGLLLEAENSLKLSKDLLTKQDLISLLELIHSSLSCTSEKSLRALMSRLNSLIQYNYSLCVLAEADRNGSMSYDAINISYPAEWLELYIVRNFKQIDPILIENYKKFDLQYFDDTFKQYGCPKTINNIMLKLDASTRTHAVAIAIEQGLIDIE